MRTDKNILLNLALVKSLVYNATAKMNITVCTPNAIGKKSRTKRLVKAINNAI